MLYHLSRPGLAAGSVVLPGRWGRLVLADPQHPWLEAEMLLEQTREVLAPGAPSRLRCGFVCEDLAAAREFQLKRPEDLIYAAELVDPSVPLHRANVRLIHPEMSRMPGWNWRVQAKEYWQPTIHEPEPGTEFVTEILVGGAIRVGGVGRRSPERRSRVRVGWEKSRSPMR